MTHRRSILAGAIAIVLLVGILNSPWYRLHKESRDFERFTKAVKENVAAQYAYQYSPNPKTKALYDQKFEDFLALRRRLKIYHLDAYFRQHGLLYFELPGTNSSVYLGKLLEAKGFQNRPVYMATIKTDDFEGIVPREFTAEGVEASTFFKDIGGGNAIFIDRASIERDCLTAKRFWKMPVRNNSYLATDDGRWTPGLQALYLAFKDTPLPSIERECVRRLINSTERHEYQHILDSENHRLKSEVVPLVVEGC